MLEMPRSRGPRDGPSAKTLTDNKDDPIRPYDFSTGSRFMCGVTNRDLYKIFMTGLDGTPIAVLCDDIKPADAWGLGALPADAAAARHARSSDVEGWLASHAGELKPIGPGEADSRGYQPSPVKTGFRCAGNTSGLWVSRAWWGQPWCRARPPR